MGRESMELHYRLGKLRHPCISSYKLDCLSLRELHLD